MTDSDQEAARTRAQRETAIKETSALFDKHVRTLNKVARKVQVILSASSVDIKAVQGHLFEYESICEAISDVFERIVEISSGSPPENVSSKFDLIDAESPKFLADVSSQIRNAVNSQENVSSEVEEKDSISKLCSQLSLGRLPVPEPDVFSGDPLEFIAWFNSFNTLIRSSSIPDTESIFYLNKYLAGEAKDCVKGFLSLCTPEAYNAALETLKDRFGSDFVVANAFRQKLRKWPKIHNDDYSGLRKFSDYLSQVETAKLSNKSLSVLDDEQENRALLFKIPDFCHKGWAKKAAKARAERSPYPEFSEFCKFIRYQSEVVNDPITRIKSSSVSGNQN